MSSETHGLRSDQWLTIGDDGVVAIHHNANANPKINMTAKPDRFNAAMIAATAAAAQIIEQYRQVAIFNARMARHDNNDRVELFMNTEGRAFIVGRKP